jgi:hypothetical protein
MDRPRRVKLQPSLYTTTKVLMSGKARQVALHTLPPCSSLKTPLKLKYGIECQPHELHSQCYELLSSAFKDHDTIMSAVYNNSNGDNQAFAASRVACITLDGRVITALTYRISQHSSLGCAILVGTAARLLPALQTSIARRRCCSMILSVLVARETSLGCNVFNLRSVLALAATSTCLICRLSCRCLAIL